MTPLSTNQLIPENSVLRNLAEHLTHLKESYPNIDRRKVSKQCVSTAEQSTENADTMLMSTYIYIHTQDKQQWKVNLQQVYGLVLDKPAVYTEY